MSLIETAELVTERLILNRIVESDADFIYRLWNDPEVVQWIGNRGVNNTDDAKKWIVENPVQSYKDNGFGLYCVRLKDTLEPIGMFGLVNRVQKVYRHDEINIGFSMLRKYRGQGLCLEGSLAVMEEAKKKNLYVVGSTNSKNVNSRKVLEKLGFTIQYSFLVPNFEGVFILLLPSDDFESRGQQPPKYVEPLPRPASPSDYPLILDGAN